MDLPASLAARARNSASEIHLRAMMPRDAHLFVSWQVYSIQFGFSKVLASKTAQAPLSCEMGLAHQSELHCPTAAAGARSRICALNMFETKGGLKLPV